MPRYERDRGKDVRFWEITREGRTLRTRTGRRGTQGKASTRELASDAEAIDAYERAIADMLAAGYVLASGPATAEQRELEAALVRDPDDPAPYLVLADVLQAAGDPRGELIALHHALAQAPRDAALVLAVKRHLDAHAGVLLGAIPAALAAIGPLFGRDAIDLQWRLGYIRELRVRVAHGGTKLTRLLKAVFDSPSAMVLTALEVRTGIVVERVYAELLDTIARRCPPTVRELRVTNTAPSPRARLVGLAARLPALRALELAATALEEHLGGLHALVELDVHDAGDRDLAAIAAEPPPQLRRLHATLDDEARLDRDGILAGRIPTLREVAFHRAPRWLDIARFDLGGIEALQLGPVSRRTARALAQGACPRLERLRLQLADDVTAADLAPILDGACAPLRELDLDGPPHRGWLETVLDRPVVRRLEALTLWNLDATDLRVLIARAGALVHLRRLRVHHVGTAASHALFDEAAGALPQLARIPAAPAAPPLVYPWAIAHGLDHGMPGSRVSSK